MNLPHPLTTVCERLQVSEDTVRDWARKGTVTLWQPGGPGGKVFVYLHGEGSNDEEFLDAWVGNEKTRTAG